ncbi:unnamed protein product [Adineta steineri]|uniref:BCL2-associated athanogene 6 n=1 Tax=Adineta steineri TaxID=433720 RepID=A0A813PDZ6_9BILA|nr:unnamed protein product [Adineta steineri]
MLEFTLKFLSGDSRKYEVDESTTVRQFRERLRDELEIPTERQRLIFQGKVLQDDTKLIDSNIQNKTIHFVERAEPIPPAGPNNSSGGASNMSGNGSNDGGMNQAMMDEVNETTSIFINAFPGAANLQPNDIQSLVQNLLNDLGDVGRQAQVNTTMASDGHGVDINIDFGNVNQVLEQQEINERFRSIGRMITRLKLRIDRIEQIVQSNFRLSPTPPPSTSERTTSPTRVTATTTTTTATASAETAPQPPPPPTSISPSSTTFLGMEDITSTEMDAESQGAINSAETLHTPPSTTSTTPVENATTPTTTNNPVISTPRTARDLAALMDNIEVEQHRLQAHYQTYLRTITQSDASEQEMAGRQRFYSLFNEATHLIAHIYHNITDFTLDLNDPADTRLLHLGELPISQAGLASIAQNSAGSLIPGQEAGARIIPRTSRSIGRRPTAVATARIMGPIQISAGANPAMMSGEFRMPFQNPMGPMPRMVFNTTPRPTMPFRPPTPTLANNGGMQQSMRFNLGTLPYTFMQMGPDGITLNQVSASVVADVQTANSSSPQQSPTNNMTNRSMPPNMSQGGAGTHVISSGPIQINGGQLDNNLAAEIAQRVTNSVQQHFAQMVGQQTASNTNSNTQSPNNNNNNQTIADTILRSTFALQPDSASSGRERNEAIRSRSADSRPRPNTSSTSGTTPSIDDDDADWVDMPSMDLPVPPQQLPNPSLAGIPRLRGPAIIQSIDRSLPCASPYFTQTLRPPFDNPNNAANLTPSEAAALSNASNRAVIFATAPQHPRGRHRHPAGPWAQQNQQQQQAQQQMQNFMLSSPGAPTGATVITPAGHAYNMTAHSFEIPMVISTTTTTEMPQQQQQTSSDNSQQQQQQQQPSTNEGEQVQMNAVISQVLSQIIPGVLRSGNGRVRLNIGQNNPNNPNNQTSQSTTSQSTGTNTTQQATATPMGTNIPGVMAGGLDFSNFARSIGNMVQGITGRLIPGATLVNANPFTTTSTVTSTTTSSSTTSNTSTSTQNTAPGNNAEVDNVTGQMFTELLRLLGGGLDNPELDNLTIGSFMQRFGEDVESRSTDGTNLISELFSTMTTRMRFTDVWNLVLGNPVGPRINEARQSATEYLQNTVLQGRPITPETLEELVNKLYESLLEEASVNFNELRVKPNINLANVMKRFFQHHVRKLLHILFDDPGNVWFEHFRQQLITMRNEYLALSSHCLEDGQAAAINFILNRHRVIFRSTNPMIVTWSETYLHTSLTNAFNAIRSSPPNISSYLIEPTPPIVERPPVRSAATPSSTTQMSSIINKTDHERQAATTSNASLQGNLPDDWIPIVIRDVNTQHNSPSQAPFSDVYKEGMPAKRRRVHMREDLTSTHLLQTLVLRASSSSSSTNNQTSNATTNTPESVLTGEPASPALVNTFEQELKRLLEQRIRQDRDYPEVQNRMPNTKRYLDGDK